jgi:hypothetical protein
MLYLMFVVICSREQRGGKLWGGSLPRADRQRPLSAASTYHGAGPCGDWPPSPCTNWARSGQSTDGCGAATAPPWWLCFQVRWRFSFLGFV